MQTFMTHNVVEISIGQTQVVDKDNGDSYMTKDITLVDENGNNIVITAFSPDCVSIETTYE